MPISVAEVLTRTDELLNDRTRIRWPAISRCGWCVDALREMLINRPEAMTINSSFTLTANSVAQALPTGYLRLVDVIRNTNGAPVSVVTRNEMDMHRPEWMQDNATSAVRHYMIDQQNPRAFWVWPKPATAFSIDATMLAEPPTSVAVDGSLPVESTYLPAIVDYVAYRAYSEDAEDSFNADRALAHRDVFLAAIGASRSNEPVTTPKQGAA